MNDTIDLTVHLPTSAQDSWALLTDPAHLKNWFGSHVSLDARLGGEFREDWSQGGRTIVTLGRVELLRPPAEIAWTWADDDWSHATLLTLTLRATKKGTTLRLLHSGWSQFGPKTGEKLRAAHEGGWRMHLEHLEDYAGRK